MLEFLFHLQRTAISTNIKERLDFSCALFGPQGDLVANAPHLPVHLGSMQEAVKYQIRKRFSSSSVEARDDDDMRWHDGDVIVANHPAAGGSHLPDITVITAVFASDVARPVFYVASRGHHADIGGIYPGSMPPFSKLLVEEGAAIESFKLVSRGVFNEAGITRLLMLPALQPGCSGARNLADNLSDLRAQVAANQKGIRLMQELIAQYSLAVVQTYMRHIQRNAERFASQSHNIFPLTLSDVYFANRAVRDMLREVAARRGITSRGSFCAIDYLDQVDSHNRRKRGQCRV
jgi:5-oxoprolinase (ATP-hydrolysing)